ncbi:MAG: hypothetical protein D6772_13125 [Bacteroidetes bacterium]|nr:MAG: hypothetical protein D6772_13125 [Bacteroidota bacterium]
MKFRIQTTDGTDTWWEYYTKDIADPDQWGRETVESFNNTLHPGEKPRTFIQSEILDADAMPYVPPARDHMCGECECMITEDEFDMFDGLCEHCKEEQYL